MINLTKRQSYLVSGIVQLLLVGIFSYILISQHQNPYLFLQREIYAANHNCDLLSLCRPSPEDTVVLIIFAIYIFTLIVGMGMLIINKNATPRSILIKLFVLAPIQVFLIWATWEVTHLLEFV